MEKNNSEEEQQLMYKLQLYEQQINQLRQQREAIEQAVEEISNLNVGLDSLKGAKDKEILAQVGKGIFAKAKLISEDLVVNVGNKNFVKKSISETKNIIDNQVNELNRLKKDLGESEEKVNAELQELMNSIIEKERASK